MNSGHFTPWWRRKRQIERDRARVEYSVVQRFHDEVQAEARKNANGVCVDFFYDEALKTVLKRWETAAK